jgi:hypothetical protein
MFGRKSAKELTGIARGVGGFIDEQQLTLEERLSYITKMMPVMGPFVEIQRTIVTFVMIHWALFAVQMFISIWLEGAGIIGEDVRKSLLDGYMGTNVGGYRVIHCWRCRHF